MVEDTSNENRTMTRHFQHSRVLPLCPVKDEIVYILREGAVEIKPLTNALK